MKTKQNKWFWLLQILGWGWLVGIQVWAKIVYTTALNETYIYLEGILVFCSGVLFTSIMRYFLKNAINFNNLKKTNFIKIIFIFLVFSLLFSCMLFIAAPIYNYFHEKDIEFNSLFIFSQIVNSLLFFFFWLLLYFGIKIVFKFNSNKTIALELKSTIKETELNTLKGQINPHFMFNSLNNIRGLMLEDVGKSREMITRLSDMLRFSLTKNDQHKIVLTEELKMIENYIALSKIQLEERLQFTQEIETEILAIKIPPMLIQMLIENAIKHGISNLPNGGKVNLKITKEDNFLIIVVKNTGKLVVNLAHGNSIKVGLNNIKKRIALIYAEQASFTIIEKNKNVIAKIVLPLY